MFYVVSYIPTEGGKGASQADIVIETYKGGYVNLRTRREGVQNAKISTMYLMDILTNT